MHSVGVLCKDTCLREKIKGRDQIEKKVFTFCFLTLLCWGMLGGAEIKGNFPLDEEEAVPVALLLMELEEDAYAILVEKSSQYLFLYKVSKGTIHLVKRFSCSTGENSGDKKQRGDKRTPEGIYFFNRVFERDELDPRYGLRAFVLDYPNLFDRSQQKGGRGIWLHGTNKQLVPHDSQGCIALTNRDLLELSNYISLYRTPIIIMEKIDYLPRGVMEERKKDFLKFIEEWHRSWEEGDLSRYMSCYSKDFTAKGMNWWQWKKYKEDLQRRNKKIKIGISQLQCFTHPYYTVVMMKQDYRSDLLTSSGVKKLYLQEKGGKIQIVGEQWYPLPMSYHLAPKASSSGAVLKRQIEEVRRFIEGWRGAWERKELATYLECYSDAFRAEGKDKGGWKRYKSDLFERYKNIEVRVRDITIDLEQGGREAKASFSQCYHTDTYTDVGLKTLHLRKEGGKWKIVGEQWKPLR